MEKLRQHGWIDADSLIVVECEKTEALEMPDWLTLKDERRYGKARVSFFRMKAEA